LFDEFNYGLIIGDDGIGKGIFPFRRSLGGANAWQGNIAASSRQYRPAMAFCIRYAHVAAEARRSLVTALEDALRIDMISPVRRGIMFKAAVSTGAATVERRIVCRDSAADQDSAKYKHVPALWSIPLSKVTVCGHGSQWVPRQLCARQ
jgi:hypothetical protein